MYHHVPPDGVHPRLFFGPRDLNALRRKMKHHDCRPLWNRLLQACERCLLTNTPDPIGERHISAAHMAFAYLITGREEFARHAKSLVMAQLDLPDWLMPSEKKVHKVRSGLHTGGALDAISPAYDWIHDYFTDEERHRLRTIVKERAFAATLQDYVDHVPMSTRYTTNGMCVLNGAVLMAALCLENEMDVSEIRNFSEKQLRQAIDVWCPDGGYSEGPLYWNYCVRHILMGIEPLRRLKKTDLYTEPFLKNTAHYALHHILPWLTHCANTADSFESTKLWPPVAALAAYHRRPEWQWLAKRLIRHEWAGSDGESLEYSLFYLVFYEPIMPDKMPDQSQKNILFSGIQHLSWRSDWSDDAVHALWLNGPANCHHNHLHLNSFTISAFQKRLLIELGKYDYSQSNDYRKRTEGHNSLLVDGRGQIITTDDSISCLCFRPGQWGTVYGAFHALREEAGALIATGRVTNAYEGRLQHFDRTLAFIRNRFFFMHDHIELMNTPPAELEWHFHSAGTIELQNFSACLVNGDVCLTLFLLTPERYRRTVFSATHELNDLLKKPVQRLDLQVKCTTKTHDLFALWVPHRREEPVPIGFDHTPSGVRITYDGKIWHYDPQRWSLSIQ